MTRPYGTYLTSADKAGIFKQDVVLSAESPTAAADELAGYVAEHTFDCKTRNLDFGTDYGLGDVLRFQTGSSMAHKQVSGVSLWLEGSTYHEEPTINELGGMTMADVFFNDQLVTANDLNQIAVDLGAADYTHFPETPPQAQYLR